MTDTPAPHILLHNDQTADMARRLLNIMPDANVAECNSYDKLPALISEFKPDAVYSVRFSGTPAFPTEA